MKSAGRRAPRRPGAAGGTAAAGAKGAAGVRAEGRADDLAGERLLVEAAQRDRARFAELYEKHFERVYAYIVRRVRDRDAAQDLTSDVFHSALAGLERFEWRGVPFAAWLFRIAANAIADRSKSSQRRAIADIAVDDLPDRSGSAHGGIDPDPYDEIERRARLFKLVEGLPIEQHRVVVMRFAEQKSIREIATALGRSEGSIKQLQFRGLQNLRARLGGTNG
ncbi:MAG TPA: RNA polymerase sigma factor [Candidatus Acidoferrales bacterium]|nr:RNA polymerase sigma factor [Candidatus Acidoferrales bacterium]